jgi:acetyl esterase/lipase
VKHIFAIALALVVAFTVARGQATDTVDVQRDIIYASPGNIPVKLDLYVPTGLAKPPPIVIYIHGGGWEGGNKENPFPLGLTKQGFAFASIEYRLSQVAIFPAQIYDCKAAVRWVRANADKYHYNADKIGLIGDSAGGHLVALLGTTANDPKLEGDEGNVGVSSAVQAVVDYYGPTDFISLPDQVTPEQRANLDNPVTHLFGSPIWNKGPVADKQEIAQLASPVFHITSTASPFFILHGDHDPIVPLKQSVEFNNALQKAGVETHLAVIKGGGHGFNDPPSAQAATDFLKKHLDVP